MKRYIILFLLFVSFTGSYSMNENGLPPNFFEDVNKIDYTKLDVDDVFMYSKMFVHYKNTNSGYKEPAIGKATIQELIVMGEAYYMEYDFSKCETILEKLNAVKKRTKKNIPYIEYLRNKLDRLTKVIQSPDYTNVVSANIYSTNEALNGIKIPFDESCIVLRFSIDSVSNQLNPKSIDIEGNYIRRVCLKSGSLGENKLEYQFLVDNTWVNSPISMDEIPSDVSFPYLSNDGITVYFSKKSLDGLGGYDLFMSRLDLDTSVFFSPSVLGMPYNSPFNDYLMLYNQKEDSFYLVTDRMLDNGYISVVKLKQLRKDSLGEMTIDQIKDYSKLNIKEFFSGENVHNLSDSNDDFYFRINKKIIIRKLSDFKSEEARKCFVKSIECKKRIFEIKNTLNENIVNYRNTSDLDNKKAISDKIEESRNVLVVLSQEYDNLLIEAKNYEIEYNTK